MVNRLRDLLTQHPEWAARLQQRILENVQDNPNIEINPVQSLDALYPWLDHFLTCLPWDGLNLPQRSVFRRIDQSIGYFYYIFGDLQYEPVIAEWIRDYNIAWGQWLSSPESWSGACYELVQTDARFELTTGKYESPDHWHCWNDFFTRRLAEGASFVGHLLADGVVTPSEGDIYDGPVKTMSPYAWEDLLGDSPYRQRIKGAQALHLSLDMYHYHRFHAPVSGQIVDMRILSGIHTDGGKIIWDPLQDRYRYAQSNNTDFQCLEPRGVMVIQRSNGRLVAMVAVGVAQVSSVNWIHGLQVGMTIHQGQELGHFACGGSDVVLLIE